MFSSLFKTVSSFFSSLKQGLKNIFSRGVVDAVCVEELRKTLIAADVGPTTTEKIITQLTEAAKTAGKTDSAALVANFREILKKILHTSTLPLTPLQGIYMLVGVNGSGKTTSAAKIASLAIHQGKRVLFVAADTFRAAAPEQLKIWAERLGIAMVIGTPGQDPASVVFTGCATWKAGQYDVMIIDTAGRMQTKLHLMEELTKVKKVVTKQTPRTPITTWLTIDSMLGQNSLDQAKIFNEATHLDGIILTKCDGTGKGGIVFAVSDELSLPIRYITTGEDLGSIAPFEPEAFIQQIME